MDIYSKPGTKIRFSGDVTQDQINWGGHDDPRGILIPGHEYTVDETEVRSWYTKLRLKEHPGKSFNTIWFEEI